MHRSSAASRAARWKAPTPPASHRARSGRHPDVRPLAGGLPMSDATFSHDPVLVDRVVELFGPVPDGVLVDATLGAGGHARAVLAAHPHLRLLGVDQDEDALAASAAVLAPFDDRVTLRHARFDRLEIGRAHV